MPTKSRNQRPDSPRRKSGVAPRPAKRPNAKAPAFANPAATSHPGSRQRGGLASEAGRPGTQGADLEGWKGWDEYAPFYDWENARTQGRRDVPFWRRLTSAAGGLVLELGSGTGRLSLPLARAGASLVGIDRSAPMLSRAVRGAAALKAGRGGRARGRLALVRGDIRALPFRSGRFRMVLAAYGVLQSILRERDLTATLDSVQRVLAPGGTFGVDLVPDVANWHEYRNRVQLRGRAAGGAHLTLIESVRQDRRRRLTTFEQRYVERTGQATAEHRFELTFRTLPVRQMAKRLEAAGFAVEAVLGDYRGRPWDERADVWIILAKKV